MAHPVSNWIHLHGNVQSRKEWSRIQDLLNQSHNSTDLITLADFLTVLNTSPDRELVNKEMRWPKWVSFEFNSPELLSFTSPDWPVSEIQDLLTIQLNAFDPKAITVLEWQNWPMACGARIAFVDEQKLLAFEKVESLDKEVFRLKYLDKNSSISEEEASTDYMWDTISNCNQTAKSAALNAGCWVTSALFDF